MSVYRFSVIIEKDKEGILPSVQNFKGVIHKGIPMRRH